MFGGRNLALETDRAGRPSLCKVEGKERAVLVIVAELDVQINWGGLYVVQGDRSGWRQRLEEEARSEQGRVQRVCAEHLTCAVHTSHLPLYTP